MSSTRKSTTGEFRQERFCSAPEFNNDAINGLAAGKRIRIVEDAATREVLWFIQYRSLEERGLKEICEALLSQFPDRLGTPTLNRVRASKRSPNEADQLKIGSEMVSDRKYHAAGRLSDISYILDRHTDDEDDARELTPAENVRIWTAEARQAATTTLQTHLISCCIDPVTDVRCSPWFFEDLFGALLTLRARYIVTARSRLADTVVSAKINDTLDFWRARRRMVLIEGVAGIGRSATAAAWVEAQAGMVRFIEVPSSSDDRSFFASIARQLGVTRGTSWKAQEIKVRVEELLSSSGLTIAFDEAQYLWGQYLRPRKTPDRLLWVKSIFDAGTPIALVALDEFSKWQEHYAKMGWADEQFVRRLNRHVILPNAHSREDMVSIARSHFPQGDQRSWKLLAAYALGTEKKQASGVVEALESACFRAEKAGRDEPTFGDIEAAIIHDHGFMSAPPASPSQTPCVAPATPFKRTQQSRSDSLLPARNRLSGPRVMPVGTT